MATSVDPNRTYALVVGVDEYDLADSRWQLPEARVAATDFALFLREKKVPAENIYLVTGGQTRDLDSKLQNCTLNDPTVSVLKSVFDKRFGGVTGDLLLVYWYGHGEMDDNQNDRLLLWETNKIRRSAVNVVDLEKALSSFPLRGFSQKFLIVDACRADGGPSSLAETFYAGKFAMPTATVIQSTPKGVKTGSEKFTPKLIAALRAAEWPPDFAGIAKALQAEVEPGESDQVRREVGPASVPAQPSLFCNRDTAVADFRGLMQAAFKDRSHRPVVCLACAESHHRPDSLMDRFLAVLNLERETQLPHKGVPWSHTDGKQIRRHITGALLNEWSEVLEPKELANAVKRRYARVPFVAIHHDIRDWTDTTAHAMKDWLAFWSEWPEMQDGPRIFVFVTVVHPLKPDWWLRTRPDPRVLRDLRALGSSPVSLVVDSFDWITREHVATLISEIGWAKSGAMREDILRRVFGDRDRRSMDEVERELMAIFDGFKTLKQKSSAA